MIDLLIQIVIEWVASLFHITVSENAMRIFLVVLVICVIGLPIVFVLVR